MLAVMIVLGLSLTAGVVVVTASWLRTADAVARTQTLLHQIGLAISSRNITPVTLSQRAYEQDVGALPTTLNDLVTKPGAVAACAYTAAKVQLSGWCGPYWSSIYSGANVFADAWGRNLVYDSANRRVYSVGANGIDEGGGGDDLVQKY